MSFEDILEDVGGFGSYQKFLMVTFLIPTYIIVAWFNLSSIFITNTPEHWCYVPELESSNLSLEQKKSLIIPDSDGSCTMFDIDYNELLITGNLTVDAEWRTKPCDHGWQYDTSDYDATAVTKWNLVCDDAHYSSLFMSLIFLGNVIGTPIYGYMSDRVGRRPMFLILTAVVAVTEIGSTLSPLFFFFLFLRFINGSCLAAHYGIGYMLLLEIVSPNIRFHINGVTTVCWAVGLSLVPLIAWLARNWLYQSAFIASSAALLLLYAKLIPESPRLLISQGRYEEAADIMGKISKANGKAAHEGNFLLHKIQKFGEELKLQKATKECKVSPLDLIRYSKLRKRFFLITLCWVGNAIPYYGIQLNVKYLFGNEFLNFFFISLIEIPANLVAWIFTEKLGRRWFSVGAYLTTGVSSLMPVFLSSEFPEVGVAASLLAKAGISASYMTLYLHAPELLPTSLRGCGMGISGAIGVGSTVIVPYIIDLSRYSTHIPFLVFFAISILSALCASFLPETLNKQLPQTVEDVENYRDENLFPCCQNNDFNAADPEDNFVTEQKSSFVVVPSQKECAFGTLPTYKKRVSICSDAERTSITHAQR